MNPVFDVSNKTSEQKGGQRSPRELGLYGLGRRGNGANISGPGLNRLVGIGRDFQGMRFGLGGKTRFADQWSRRAECFNLRLQNHFQKKEE